MATRLDRASRIGQSLGSKNRELVRVVPRWQKTAQSALQPIQQGRLSASFRCPSPPVRYPFGEDRTSANEKMTGAQNPPPSNFRRLVLCCIKSDFHNQICVGKRLTRSTQSINKASCTSGNVEEIFKNRSKYDNFEFLKISKILLKF